LKLEEFAFVTGIPTPETRRLSQEHQLLLRTQTNPLAEVAGTILSSGILSEPECVLVEEQSLLQHLAGDLTDITAGIRGMYSEKQPLLQESAASTTINARDIKLDEKQLLPSAFPDFKSNKPFGNIAGVRVGVSQILEERCNQWCSCVCHKRAHHRTPARLNRALGSLFVGYTSLPFLSPPCNEKRCRKRSSPSVRVNYYFPPWFAMRALVFMATQFNTGPEFLLRVTRICPPNAEIFFFAETGNVEGMKSLFQKGFASPYDVEYGTGVSALHKAVDWRQMDTIQLLLSAGANPFLEDMNGWAAADTVAQLSFTNSSGHQHAFNELLRALDMDIFETLQFSTLHKIVLNLCSLDLEQTLIASTADIDAPDSKGQTPLFWAAIQGDAKSVRLLLTYGANPNLISIWSEVPLHWSIEASHDTCTRLLLEHGAIPNIRSSFGTTPLHYAVWTHEDPANHVEPLVRYGADVNLQNLKGRVPLHYALSKDWTGPVAFLLDKGANIEHADNDGVTPLIEALKNDLPKVTNLLLQRGANHLVRDKNDDSILHIAAAKSTIETFKILELHDLKDIDIEGINTAGETPRDLVLSRHDKTDELVIAFDRLLDVLRTKNATKVTVTKCDIAEVESDCELGGDVFEDALEFLDTG
jgi:ankyrin repeat protein